MSNGFEAACGSYKAAAERKAAKTAARKKSHRQETQRVFVFEATDKPKEKPKFMKAFITTTKDAYVMKVLYKHDEPRIIEYPRWCCPRNFILPQLCEEAVKFMAKKNKSALQTLKNKLQTDKTSQMHEVVQMLTEELTANAV